MNYEVYKSMDALEAATALDEVHFFAQLKYAELFFRLRALERPKRRRSKRSTWRQRLGTVDGPETAAGDPPASTRWNAEADLEQTSADAGSGIAGARGILIHSHGGFEMKWKYFGGACLVVRARC